MARLNLGCQTCDRVQDDLGGGEVQGALLMRRRREPEGGEDSDDETDSHWSSFIQNRPNGTSSAI